MTVEELLKPRIKVIAPMPLMVNEVGDYLERIETKKGVYFGIMTKEKMVLYPEKAFKEWPHIFKEVSWWEDREEKDMPEYLFNEATNKIEKVDWEYNRNRFKCISNGHYMAIHLHYKPSDKKEYEQYQQSKPIKP